MPSILYNDVEYTVQENKSVLETLEDNGHAVPNACRSGVCQSCLLKAVKGTPPPESQKGLKATLVAQGYFLSCRCVPTEDLGVALPDAAGLQCAARIKHVRKLSERVLEVALSPEGEFQYRPGQFLTLINASGAARSYSIASVPEHDDALHLQIALMPNGVMSSWIASEHSADAAVRLQGPHGNCFYVPGNSDQPILLVGTGTGLAPLYGIVRDALAQGHTGAIHLFHGSLREDGLYCVADLQALADKHENFNYTACVLEGPAAEGIHVGAIDVLAIERLPQLKGYRAYLCGAPELVKIMQRKVFLAGVSMQEIFSDPFVPAAAKV